jgi:CRP-like cAMP-binding protein
VASKKAKNKGHRRFEPANTEAEGASRFRDRLADWEIPKAIIDDFTRYQTLLSYRKGAIIFPQGSRSEFLAWTHSGVIETACCQVDDRRIVTRLVGPGEIFGYQSLVGPDGHLVHAFELRARTECQVALVSHERIVEALQTLAPAVLVRLLQNITAAWAETERYWARFFMLNYRQRLEMIFADLAVRFGTREPHGEVLILELGHYDLAGMIGCSRPMLSQLIATMMREGKISRRDKRYILLNGKKRLGNPGRG